MPYIGFIVLFLTILGTIFGLLMLSGVIGNHNYLAQTEGQYRQNSTVAPSNP